MIEALNTGKELECAQAYLRPSYPQGMGPQATDAFQSQLKQVTVQLKEEPGSLLLRLLVLGQGLPFVSLRIAFPVGFWSEATPITVPGFLVSGSPKWFYKSFRFLHLTLALKLLESHLPLSKFSTACNCVLHANILHPNLHPCRQ